MKASEAYDRFLIKSEKNSTNDNLSTDKGRFAILYNEHQNRFVEYCYQKKNSDFIRNIQCLLTESSNLKEKNNTKSYATFELPINYFAFSNITAKASTDKCFNKTLTLYEIKDFNRNLVLSDEFTKPSFGYREAPYEIADNSVKIFVDSFNVHNVKISYYRYPLQIKLYDINNPESDFVDSYDLDFDEKIIDRIISSAVSGFDINNSSQRWQLHDLESKNEL